MKRVRRPQGRTTRCAVALSALRTPRYNVPVIPQRTAVLRTPCRLPFRLPDPFMANAPTRTGKVDGTRSHRRLAASLAARTCCFPAISSRMMTREVVLVGAPWCEGQNLEGADLAPDAMRDAGLSDAVKSLGLSFTDRGDVDFTSVAPSTNHYSIGLYREWLSSNPTANFATWMRKRETNKKKKSGESTMARKRSYETALHEQSLINVVNAELIGDGLRLVHDAVHAAVLREGPQKPFVLTVGGDHSIASASISALQAQHPNLGVIWVDAHADANTPRSSPSGHYHGMPAAHLLGWFEKPGEMGEGSKAVSLPGFDWFPSGCLSESRLAYIGLRDVDPEEARLLRRSGVRIFTMRDVDKHGIAKVIEMAIEAVGPSMDNPLHLSLDVDAIDPHYAPGTGTAARGGLTYREIHYICEECALTKRLVSMDVVEVNPGLDPPPEKSANPLEEAGAMHGDHPSIRRASPTVRLAVELVLSALGKQIC